MGGGLADTLKKKGEGRRGELKQENISSVDNTVITTPILTFNVSVLGDGVLCCRGTNHITVTVLKPQMWTMTENMDHDQVQHDTESIQG